MHAVVTGGGVADARGHEVALASDPDARANTIPITPRSGKLEIEPMIVLRADIFPQLQRLSQRSYDHVHSAVVVEVGIGAPPLAAASIKPLSGLGGHAPKFSAP